MGILTVTRTILEKTTYFRISLFTQAETTAEVCLPVTTAACPFIVEVLEMFVVRMVPQTLSAAAPGAASGTPSMACNPRTARIDLAV
eukprot:scaffold741_cov336-Pavlova_lutheri.AAC.28